MIKIRYFPVIGSLLFAASAVASGPNTQLQAVSGDKASLAQYIGKGKWVLFNVWGPKCPPCLEEISELVSFHEDHKDSDALVVSMALDFPSFGYAKKDQVIDFIEDYFVTYPVMLGDARLSEQVTGRPLRGTPSSYLYDPQGKLVIVQVGTVTQNLLERLIALHERKLTSVSAGGSGK